MNKKLEKNFKELQAFGLKNGCKIIAISKTKPVAQIKELYQIGQRIFGENLVQEMVEKHTQLPNDIEWHMVGHLQSNKVKNIAPFVHTIHSIDSFKLLTEIEKQAAKCNRKIHCLLQIDISGEETKYGFDFVELIAELSQVNLKEFPHIIFNGVMGIASNSDSSVQIQGDFNDLKNHFKALKESYFKHTSSFTEISMGMSNDYEIAIEQGSTMIRVGRLIFGDRVYNG